MEICEHTITTDATGTRVIETGPLAGELQSIVYTKVDYADGVGFNIVAIRTGQTLWSQSGVNATKRVNPRVPMHKSTGAEVILGTGLGTFHDRYFLAGEKVRIEVYNGGANKSGKFTIVTG